MIFLSKVRWPCRELAREAVSPVALPRRRFSPMLTAHPCDDTRLIGVNGNRGHPDRLSRESEILS